MSFFVSYNICCRECTIINGVRGYIEFQGDNSLEDRERILNLTEYEYSKELTVVLQELNSQCHFCTSENIYPENIQVGDIDLYDFDKIVQILKNENNETGFFIYNLIMQNGSKDEGIAGKSNNSKLFLKQCWDKVLEEILKMPEEYFIENQNSYQFFVSISGINYHGNFSPVIHRLKLCGLSKPNVIHSIGKYLG